MEDISARVSALEGAVASYVEEQPTWPYRGYINDTYDDPLSMATKRMIENTKNLKKAATEDATTAGRIVRGTGKGIQQYVEGFTKIVQEMASNRAVVEINNKLGKVANGEDVKFTDQERMFLQVMVDNAKIQDEYGKRIGISYKIGEAFGQSLGFMAEFVMTGGLASGATILGQGAKVVSKAVQIGRATKVGKVATNMAIKAAQAGVQTLGMPSFYQKVAIGVSNGETFGGALLDSYWQMWAENMSERIFMSKIVPGKEGANVLDRMLGRMGTTITTEKGALGVLKSTLEESAEEKIGEILTAPKDFDNFSEFWKSFTDVEQNKIMLGSVSLMTGLMGSPAVALNAYDKVSTGIKVDQLRSVLDADITGGIDKIYSEKDLNAKDAMSLVFDLIDGKIKQLPRDTNYPQVVSDALRYAQLKAKQTAMAGLTEKEFNELLKEKQGKIEPVVEPVEETPELTEQQKQIDYLKSRGQVIPDGTDMETLNKMFSAEKTKERTEVNTEIDTKVKAAQEKLGLPQTPDIEISDDTEATLDRLDEGLPVTNEFIKAASQELYDRYKELEAMKTSDTRLYTTEQIESMQGYLGEEIERLENYASEQKETGEFVSEVKVGEVAKGNAEGVTEGVSEVVGEPQKPVETVSKESGQIVPAEEKAAVKPSEEAVAGNIKNGRVRTVLPVEKPDTYLEYNGKRIHELDEIEDLLANGDDSWAYSEGKSGLKRAINDEMPYWRESPNAELLLKQANWLLDKIDNGEVTQVKSSFVELIGDKEKTIKNDFIKGKLGRIVKSIDESLSGKLKRAIDSWLGVTTDMKKSGIITGVMNESPLENLYASEPTIIEEAMAETKSHLREKYGDTITLYRSEDVDFGKRSKRTLLSYTSDPLVADFFYKAGKTNLIKEEIPIDDIVWVTDRMNQSEFIVKSEGVEDAVQVKEAGRVPVQPAPGVGEKVEGRAPEAKPKEVTGEKKEVSWKQQQFDVIQRSNPMTDEVHTGIRKVEDIKTADEVFAEPIKNNENPTPDFTVADMKAALESGEVTIYSSNEIADGVFVTPSKMQAKSYSGDGKVYSKKVALADVAWIDMFEGQYAKVKEVKKESDDKKRKRRLQRTDRQPAANGQPIVGKGETSAQGVRLVDGTIVKAGDEVVYKGETRKVKSVKGDVVTIPGVGDVHKSKVLAPTKPVLDTRSFNLEETNPNKVNDDLLSDEVFDKMRMNNIEPSDTDVLGTAALAKSLMNGDVTVEAAINEAVDRFAKRGTVPDHVPFFKAAPGAKHTSPYATYNDAVRGGDNVGKNLWVRNTPFSKNTDRVLLVQFSSNFLYGKQPFKRDKSSSYFDKLYRLVAGYNRTVDFWEVPLWMARIAGLQRNADVYVVRDIEEAKRFINEAGYKSVHFSALDVNEKHIVDIVSNTPGTTYQIGGYTDFKRIESFPNVTVYKSIDEYVKNNKLSDIDGTYSYRHFKGTAVIPRLKLSEGCLYKCAFCSIPKKVIPIKKEWIDSQIESIKDLDATLVYLDDKTFGQAENYTLLPELYERIKEYNPDFKGFIIQTTALDFANKKRFSPEYLKNSHIQFVELGVETYNDDILTKLNKKHSHKKFVDAAMQNARDNNIKVIPNIIVGLSWNEGTKEKPDIKTETRETYQNTLDFLEDNKDIISHVNVYSLALYEGTELSDAIDVKEEADKNENIVAKSWQQNKEDHEWAMDEFSDFASNQIQEEKKDEVQKEEKGLRNEKVNKRFRKISKQTGTDAKTVERMYNTLMDVFGLSQDKALAGAVIVDRMVGTMAKRTNKTKDQVYATIKWEKGGAIAEMAGVKQDVLGKARGATMFMDDANAVIMALTDPNVTTPLHELTHVYEKYLTAKEKEQILKWTGEKSWSVNTSESFARGSERFLYDGTAPGNLKAIFQKFAAWLKDIYKTLVASEINIALNEDMRRIYSTMLGSEYVEEKVPSQAPETAEEAADAFFGSAPVDADGNIILSDEEIADEFFSGLEVDENGVIKFQFIGATGAARLDAAENNNNRIFNLREAMKMTDANKTAEEIKLATGWEKGKDKRWRYEIPDNMKMRPAWDKLKVSDFNDKYELPITEAMDYPELFAAYPELEKIKIRKDTAFLDIFQSVQGWYDHDSMELVVSPNAIDPFGTILHELQHAVQMVEGFATGSNTEDIIDAIPDFEFESVVDQLVEQLERDIKKNTEKNLTRRKILSGLTAKEEADIRRYSKEIIAAGEEGDRLYKEEKKKFPDKNPFLDNKKLAELRQVKHELRDKINDIIERVLGERSITLAVEFSYGIEAVEEVIDETTNKIIEDNKSVKVIKAGADRATIIKNFSPVIGDMAYNYYKRVAGETEARNVATRAKLTPEQRRSTAESTEDIPRDQQIVMRGGKVVSMDRILFQEPKSKRDIAVDMLYGLIKNETSKEAARARIDAYLTSRGIKFGVDGGNIVAEAIARLGLSETVVEAPVRPTKKGEPSGRVVAERPLSGKVKESKLGIRVIDGESAMPHHIKNEIMAGNLHKYDVFPDEVADSTAGELYRANGLDGSIAIFSSRENRLHAKLEVFLGAYIVEGINREISRAEKDGRIGDANYWATRMVNFTKDYIATVSVERAQGLAALNSARVQSLFPSRAFLMKYEMAVSETRKGAMDTRTFKRKVKQIKNDGKKAHKDVLDDVLDDLSKKLGSIKEGASLREMMKQKKALLDELKARRKNPPKMQIPIPSIPGLDPVDVAYGASIASVYIQAGIYGEKLVKGLVKDFKSIGVDITEEQAEKMVPSVINVGGTEVSVDDFLDELEGEKEAMRLANRIFGAITPKKETKDPLTMMLNTLMAKFNERNLNKPERKKVSDIEKIGEAIRDKEHYAETWKEARRIALDMIEANEEMDIDQKEIMSKMIDDAYDKATSFVFSEGQVDRAIRAKMKDMGMVLADIVRSHFDVQVRNRGSLTEAIIIDAGIDRADAEMLARAIERRYDSLMSEHGRRLIKKYTQHLTPTQKRSVGRRSNEERLLELINIGAFDDPSFVDAFASARGLVTIDPVHVRNIKAKAEEINKQKSRVLRLKKTEDLLGYMATLEGVSLAEIGDAVWYASVLSGMSTQVRNIMGGGAGVGINLATEMLWHPSYVPAMLRGIWRGVKFGKEKAEDVLKYGYSPYETRVETPRVVERYIMNPKALWIPPLAHVFNNLKYVSRFMAAADMFNVSVGKEAWAELLALEHLKLNDKKVSGLDYIFDSKYRKQVRSAINTFLGVTK